MIKRFQVTLESFAWGEKQKVGVLNSRSEVLKKIVVRWQEIFVVIFILFFLLQVVVKQ